MWRLGDEEDKIHLRPEALPGDELAAVLCLLVGVNQEYPPSAFTPLFLRKDREPLVLSRPTFDARGLVPPVLSEAPAAPKPMEVSSDESGGGKEEEGDSEANLEEMGGNSPLSKAEILRGLPDHAKVDARQEEGELPVVPMRSRSSLIPQDAASALTPPGAASSPPAVLSSAPGIRAPTSRAPQLSGFKLPKRKYVAVDQYVFDLHLVFAHVATS